MNGVDYVADTNILIYLLEGNPSTHPFIESVFAVSVISEIELLAWHKVDKHTTSTIKGFLSNCFVIDLLPPIKDIAIDIRQKNRLKSPDAIIAATAIYLQLPLLTADKALIKIEGLNTLFISQA